LYTFHPENKILPTVVLSSFQEQLFFARCIVAICTIDENISPRINKGHSVRYLMFKFQRLGAALVCSSASNAKKGRGYEGKA
jgi:hypothetical protein